MAEKYQYFNGLKFTRDEKTGYYLNSTIRKRMHRYVWEFYNGPIQKGHHIHHKDGDKSNNDISNLESIHGSRHAHSHAKKWHSEHKDEVKANLDKIRDLTKEWHQSEEGKEWHSRHAVKVFNQTRVMICQMCGKEYETKYHGDNKFCSNNCKSRWRRQSGVDNVSKICEFCGKEFVSNKYKNAKYCSRSCANKAK